MKERNGKLGFVMIWVSGFVMYMLLAIFFWMEATAAPIGGKQDLDAESVGFWHEYYNEEQYNGVATVAISTMLKTAIYTRAYEECRDRAGEVDYDCFSNRQAHIFDVMVTHLKEKGYGGTNSDFVQHFWQYVIAVEMDETASLGLATSMYVSKVLDYLEPRS